MNLKTVSVIEYCCDQLFLHYAVILNTGSISEQDQSMTVTGTYESFPEKVWKWDKVQRRLYQYSTEKQRQVPLFRQFLFTFSG